MGQHHESVLLDDEICVGETLVQLVAVLVNDVVKRNSDVSERDNNVAPDVRILRRLENLEQKMMVCVAELGTDAQELAERERSRRPQCPVLCGKVS